VFEKLLGTKIPLSPAIFNVPIPEGDVYVAWDGGFNAF
jgi:hypothetical protein